MSKYHHLIAGLPDITLDDSKQAYTVYDFREEIYKILSRNDKKLISLFFLKYDNQNLLRWLKEYTSEQYEPSREIESWDNRGSFSADDFELAVSTLKKGEKTGKSVPPYMADFLKLYLDIDNKKGKDDFDEIPDKDEEKEAEITGDDRLAALYYAFAMKCGNKFISRWFELNLIIKNILTAITCRKYGLDKNLYLVGDDPVTINLRTSNSRDFDLGDDVEYLSDLLRLAEEGNLVTREKKIDALKWEWLEYNTIFKVFDIESVFAYLLKTEMIERWTALDKSTGEATFRELIKAMKKDSNTALDEFKKKNNKK